MATLLYAVVDPTTGGCASRTPGHPPPLVVRAGRRGALARGSAGAAARRAAVRRATARREPTLEPGDDARALHRRPGRAPRRAARRAGSSALRGAGRGVPASPTQLCDALCTERLVPTRRPRDDVAVLAAPHRAGRGDACDAAPAAEPEALAQCGACCAAGCASPARARDVADDQLACGEACANAIEHAYAPGQASFELEATARGRAS